MPEEEGGVRLRTMKTRPAPFPANEVTWRSTGLGSPERGEGLRERAACGRRVRTLGVGVRVFAFRGSSSVSHACQRASSAGSQCASHSAQRRMVATPSRCIAAVDLTSNALPVEMADVDVSVADEM
jgi:hypothetical protein